MSYAALSQATLARIRALSSALFSSGLVDAAARGVPGMRAGGDSLDRPDRDVSRRRKSRRSKNAMMYREDHSTLWTVIVGCLLTRSSLGSRRLSSLSPPSVACRIHLMHVDEEFDELGLRRIMR